MNLGHIQRQAYQRLWQRGLRDCPGWVASLHPKQRDALRATTPLVTVAAGRRGGKTNLAVSKLLESVREYGDGAVALYLALTMRSAKSILWPELLAADQRWGIGLKLHRTESAATFPGGGRIELAGADQENFIERLRGKPYSVAIVDEAASLRDSLLSYLCNEVLGPGLSDCEGQLWQIGSPGAACAGHFFEMSTDRAKYPQCSNYHFTLLDNPKFAGRGERILAEKREQMGWDETTPAYMREYLGLWTRDPDWLVYSYDSQRNLRVPTGRLTYVISVDLGSSETTRSTCYCVLGYRAGECYVVEVIKRASETTATIGDMLLELERRYNPVAVVMDAGGLGGAYVREIKGRLRTPIKPAEKAAKLAYIELINSDLRTGALMIDPRCSELIGEIAILQWSEDRKSPDPRYQDHACDAMLYGWRECRHWQPAKVSCPVSKTEEELAEEREDALAKRKWWER